jgi:hypothetical protein
MPSKKRKYTGWDGDAKGKLAGTEKFKDWVMFLYGGKIKNLGTWKVRNMKNANLKNPQPSVHGTGRAWDAGYKVREDGLSLADFCVRNAEALGIEAIHDYAFGQYGRGWRCNRNEWIVYSKPTLGGRGNWLHIELSPEVAKDAGYIDAVFQCLLKPAK